MTGEKTVVWEHVVPGGRYRYACYQLTGGSVTTVCCEEATPDGWANAEGYRVRMNWPDVVAMARAILVHEAANVDAPHREG